MSEKRHTGDKASWSRLRHVLTRLWIQILKLTCAVMQHKENSNKTSQMHYAQLHQGLLQAIKNIPQFPQHHEANNAHATETMRWHQYIRGSSKIRQKQPAPITRLWHVKCLNSVCKYDYREKKITRKKCTKMLMILSLGGEKTYFYLKKKMSLRHPLAFITVKNKIVLGLKK